MRLTRQGIMRDLRLAGERIKKLCRSLRHGAVAGTHTLYFSSTAPVISVLIPVYNTRPHILKQTVESVLSQTFPRWELCMADDGSTREATRQVLESYAASDPRIRVVFSETNRGIAATINRAAGMARGLFIGVLDHDDMLAPDALQAYYALIRQHPDTDLIYCDEDKIGLDGGFCHPWYKPAWNPDLSLSFNYVMHFAVYRRRLFGKLGGVRSEYEGSQDYDLLLRTAERTPRIRHISRVLYHWRMDDGSTALGPEEKPRIFVRGLAALNDALRRRGIDGDAVDAPDAWKGVFRVRRTVAAPLTITAVIASFGDFQGLDRLLGSLAAQDDPAAGSEVIILHDPGSRPRTDARFHDMFRLRFIASGHGALPARFNTGAEAAGGRLLLFLDDTMELLSSDTVRSLVEQAQRDEVGAVNGKIYYEDGRVEHAGIILGPFGIMGYSHRATPDDAGYVGLKNMIGNFSAVMGLGMMTRKTVFQSAGGFDADRYARAYWDADYCLRLGRDNRLITYTPYARMRHRIPVKSVGQMVVEPEAARFRDVWQEKIDNDPFFNPNLSRDREDFYWPGKNSGGE